MAASTIVRTGVTLTNDSGTAAAPAQDGTLLNAAWCSTFLDRIDALFSGALTIGGLLTAEGFGTHTFSAAGSGAQRLVVRNSSAGTGNYATLAVGTDAATTVTELIATASTYTTNGAYVGDGSIIKAHRSGGLSVIASDSSGAIRFYTGGLYKRAALVSGGHLVLEELTTNPSTDDCTADAAVAIYTKADKLVFAYNNGGTMTYITLDLDGSDTTWTHGTTAP